MKNRNEKKFTEFEIPYGELAGTMANEDLQDKTNKSKKMTVKEFKQKLSEYPKNSVIINPKPGMFNVVNQYEVGDVIDALNNFPQDEYLENPFPNMITTKDLSAIYYLDKNYIPDHSTNRELNESCVGQETLIPFSNRVTSDICQDDKNSRGLLSHEPDNFENTFCDPFHTAFCQERDNGKIVSDVIMEYERGAEERKAQIDAEAAKKKMEIDLQTKKDVIDTLMEFNFQANMSRTGAVMCYIADSIYPDKNK